MRVQGGRGQVVAVHRNRDLLPVQLRVVTSDDEVVWFDAERGPHEGPLGSFFRVEVKALHPTPHRTVITNPIFLTAP